MAAHQFGEYEFVSRLVDDDLTVEVKGNYGRRVLIGREPMTRAELLGFAAAFLAAAREFEG